MEKGHEPAETATDELQTNPGATGETVAHPKDPDPPALPVQYVSAIINGTGVGLFLGILLGLAVSPVVSGIIGTLSSLLVVLLGLNDKYLTSIKSLRIGFFGIFAVAGVLLGMYIRTNDALSPTTTELKDEYSLAGYSDDQALYYISQQMFGHVPSGWFGTSASDTVFSKAGANNPQKSILFSTTVDAGQCYMLKSAKSTFPKSEIINSFKRAGGAWATFAEKMQEGLPDQAYVDAMLVLRDSFCGLGAGGEITIETSDKLNALTKNNTLAEFEETMRSAGENWQTVLGNAQEKLSPEYQKTFYLSLIKNIKDEKMD